MASCHAKNEVGPVQKSSAIERFSARRRGRIYSMKMQFDVWLLVALCSFPRHKYFFRLFPVPPSTQSCPCKEYVHNSTYRTAYQVCCDPWLLVPLSILFICDVASSSVFLDSPHSPSHSSAKPSDQGTLGVLVVVVGGGHFSAFYFTICIF